MLAQQQQSQNSSSNDFGIVAMDWYIPRQFVNQTQLELFDSVSQGKYTIGLGQSNMAVADDREDIQSMCLSVVSSLMAKNPHISYADIGRLEVGTETIIDKSKSVKSTLMSLFKESGNSNVEGVDTTNACYGGTNALFNALNWLESSYWDGKSYALVVAADIAVYKSGSARPTGGAGAVAMLLGPNAPIVFEPGMRVSHMEHVYDFYKPDLHSEYPEVDGPLSNACYIKAVDTCYSRFVDKVVNLNNSGTSKNNTPSANSDDIVAETLADYYVFHSPYTKLVQKSFARLSYNDYIRYPTHPKFSAADTNITSILESAAQAAASGDIAASYTNKDLEKAVVGLTKSEFSKRVEPGLLVAKHVGNMYCASLYGGLVSLIGGGGVSSDDLIGKRVMLFSYGSGLASSMFSIRITGSTAQIAAQLGVPKRLAARTEVSPQRYNDIMETREKMHNARDCVPVGGCDEGLWQGAVVLDKVDDKFRRIYRVVQ